MLKTIKYWCVLVLAAGMLSQAASAVVISITPSTQAVNLGETASVDVSISDFDIDEALGVFDFEFLFDDSILSLDNVIFGTQLFFSDQFEDDFGGGLYAIFESSLEDPMFLVDNQADSFLLFTMEFTAINFGSSDVEVDFADLGDQNGDLLAFDDYSPITINVLNPNAASEPGHLAILFLGLGLIAWRRRLKK